MHRDTVLTQKRHNLLHTLVLILSMSGLLGYLAWVIGGEGLAVVALLLVVVGYLLTPMVSPSWVLRLYHSQPIGPGAAPELHAVLQTLARRANLKRLPLLFYVPSDVMNAFAVGGPDSPAIALSDGLLRRLSLAETAGVLAHEISHIRQNDIRVMGFADLIERVTRVLSILGQVLLLMNLPLLLFTPFSIDWLSIGLLIFAPGISVLGQLSLARTREYNADLNAAELLGDPLPLASALRKMERVQGGLFEQFIGPGRRLPDPSLLRTHPATEERIRRLLALRPRHGLPHLGADSNPGVRVADTPLAPRWHSNGNWF